MVLVATLKAVLKAQKLVIVLPFRILMFLLRHSKIFFNLGIIYVISRHISRAICGHSSRHIANKVFAPFRVETVVGYCEKTSPWWSVAINWNRPVSHWMLRPAIGPGFQFEFQNIWQHHSVAWLTRPSTVQPLGHPVEVRWIRTYKRQRRHFKSHAFRKHKSSCSSVPTIGMLPYLMISAACAGLLHLAFTYRVSGRSASPSGVNRTAELRAEEEEEREENDPENDIDCVNCQPGQAEQSHTSQGSNNRLLDHHGSESGNKTPVPESQQPAMQVESDLVSLSLEKDTQAAASLQSATDTFRCPCCFEDVPFDQVVFLSSDCEHEICKSCGVRWVKQVALSGESLESVQCPACMAAHAGSLQRHPPLHGMVNLATLRTLLFGATVPSHLRSAFRAAVRLPSSRLVRCVKDECDGYGCTTAESGRATCFKCGMEWCSVCACAWHNDLKSCVEYQATVNDTQEAKIVHDLAHQNGWKQCPSCNQYVERFDGCNRIKCRCGQLFCYICAEKLDRRDPYSHFSVDIDDEGAVEQGCAFVTIIQEDAN